MRLFSLFMIGYRKAEPDLHLCFHIFRLLVFPCSGSYNQGQLVLTLMFITGITNQTKK